MAINWGTAQSAGAGGPKLNMSAMIGKVAVLHVHQRLDRYWMPAYKNTPAGFRDAVELSGFTIDPMSREVIEYHNQIIVAGRMIAAAKNNVGHWIIGTVTSSEQQGITWIAKHDDPNFTTPQVEALVEAFKLPEPGDYSDRMREPTRDELAAMEARRQRFENRDQQSGGQGAGPQQWGQQGQAQPQQWGQPAQPQQWGPQAPQQPGPQQWGPPQQPGPQQWGQPTPSAQQPGQRYDQRMEAYQEQRPVPQQQPWGPQGQQQAPAQQSWGPQGMPAHSEFDPRGNQGQPQGGPADPWSDQQMSTMDRIAAQGQQQNHHGQPQAPGAPF